MDKETEKTIEELLTRGVKDAIVKENLKRKLMSGKKLRVKFGIDPTGPKIHLGRASTMRKLKKFQDLGHQVVLIIGDFTAQIGDASDKDSERPMLTLEQVKKNMENYLPQLGRIFDIEKAEVHYNSEWLGKLNFQDICFLANQFSVSQMLDRENFSQRFKKGERISLREFLYPLMQGYDSVAIKADIEMGGSDQLFNVLAGRVLQKAYGQKPQDILTFQLLDGTDGRKMSTSWGNVILISDSPADIYGKIMSMRDEMIAQYFYLATDVPLPEVREMEKQLAEEKVNPRDLKMRLAREIIALYYDEAAAREAEEKFKEIFQKKELPDEMPEFAFSEDKKNIVDLLVETKLCASKSEARRLLKQGGIKVGGKKITEEEDISFSSAGIVLQRGKRFFCRVKKK